MPKKRPEGYEGSWLRLIFQKKPSQRGNFGKRGQLLSICPKVWLLIGGGNGILDRFLLVLPAY
ncbi:MAG: hypothetical protein HC804_02980 [Anaerolineae bacterium]|nr:hypothetical protein [Anaerolineae bacterium]